MHEVQVAGQRVARHESPSSLAEALALLARHGDRARPVAGGTDLLVELDRGTRPGVEVLVDLTRIPGLDGVAEADGRLTIGPLVTHNQVVASPVLVQRALPLAQACHEIGSPQLRNRATVVGNVVTASPANDTISALLALDAVVEVTALRGRRQVPLGDFHPGFRVTVLGPGELVTGISFPALAGRRRGVFAKLGLRRAQAISVVHTAVVLDLDDDGRAGDVRVVLGSVAPTVVRCPRAEAVLEGAVLDPATIERAAAAARATVTPIDDLRGTAAYRLDALAVLVARSLHALGGGFEASAWPRRPPLLWGTGDGSPIGPAPATSGHDDTTPVAATVNGRPVQAAGAASRSLLDWLREEVGLTGTKEGCAEGECGACTVFLDGSAVMGCLVPAARADGAEVLTIEGLAPGDGRLHALQQAFIDTGAVQCGYCIPGFLMAGAKLLEEVPRPDREQVRQALAGNLCRCTGYYTIMAAVDRAAALLAGPPTS
jgi:xanthine dehydrogenase iron-sulfur cluster and FAD-binding subunit A